MFPLNFWSESTSSISSGSTISPKENGSVLKNQSETQTNTLLKVRELVSSENKQNEIILRRQSVLGHDHRFMTDPKP